jgi:hypothetical protein
LAACLGYIIALTLIADLFIGFLGDKANGRAWVPLYSIAITSHGIVRRSSGCIVKLELFAVVYLPDPTTVPSLPTPLQVSATALDATTRRVRLAG